MKIIHRLTELDSSFAQYMRIRYHWRNWLLPRIIWLTILLAFEIMLIVNMYGEPIIGASLVAVAGIQ